MPRKLPDESEILACLAGQDRALHVAEVASRLGVPAAARRGLTRELSRLSQAGRITGLRGQRFRAARAASSESWEGAFSSHPRGFGFVNAVGRDDVYVPPSAVGGALHGDTVSVQIVARSARGTEGRVERVISRRPRRVPGVLRRRRQSAWLEPDDDRIRGPIVIAGKSSPGRDGEAVIVELTRFPESSDENPEGEVVEVLGTPGEAAVEVRKILAREGIDEEYDEKAVAQAERHAKRLSKSSLEGRKDLRSVPLLTIDPVDARDHDDAVYVERRPERGYRAYVAIADVSEYVTAGGLVDREAAKRCFTTYLPDRAVPMLPSLLAADHCSLLPDQDRFCLCAIIDLDRAGTPKRFRLVEGVAHVAAKISYGDAAAALGYSKDVEPSEAARRHEKDLRVLAELARKLRRARLARGALDLDLPEPRVELDDDKRPVAVTRRATDPGIRQAYQLVEEMMLLCNERVARWLKGRRSPAVYRVHGTPDEERLEQLGRAARVLGAPFDAETLSEPRGVSRWLSKIDGHPAKLVLEGLLLRSLKMAQYDVENVGHFGLASEAYVHFTSPIRRYPDLLVHRLCKHLLRGGSPDRSPAALEELTRSAQRSSETERVVLGAEREVVDVYRCLLMRDRVGDVCEGRVSGLSGSGLYVVLDEPFVDVLVRFEALGPDRYEASDDGLSVTGSRSGDRVSLGDRLTLVIEDVVLARRTIYGRRLPPERAHRGARPGEPEPPRQRRERGGNRGEPSEASGPGRRSRRRRGDSSPSRRSRSR